MAVPNSIRFLGFALQMWNLLRAFLQPDSSNLRRNPDPRETEQLTLLTDAPDFGALLANAILQLDAELFQTDASYLFGNLHVFIQVTSQVKLSVWVSKFLRLRRTHGHERSAHAS